jgi:hypothetical protein
MSTEKLSDSRTRFARRVFTIAAIYGVLVLIPQYFLEGKLGRDFPPPITHPEHFYGFIGVALAWQVLFFIIAKDPVRYRAAMIPAILEKLTFVVACIVLYAQGRLAPMILIPAGLDLILALMFAISYRITPKQG